MQKFEKELSLEMQKAFFRTYFNTLNELGKVKLIIDFKNLVKAKHPEKFKQLTKTN